MVQGNFNSSPHTQNAVLFKRGIFLSTLSNCFIEIISFFLKRMEKESI